MTLKSKCSSCTWPFRASFGVVRQGISLQKPSDMAFAQDPSMYSINSRYVLISITKNFVGYMLFDILPNQGIHFFSHKNKT